MIPKSETSLGGSGRTLVTLSIIVVFFALASTSQATQGPVLIGIACYLGIMARIIQAGRVADRKEDGSY